MGNDVRSITRFDSDATTKVSLSNVNYGLKVAYNALSLSLRINTYVFIMTHEQRNYSESIQYATVYECACYKSPVIVLSHAKNKHQFQ